MRIATALVRAAAVFDASVSTPPSAVAIDTSVLYYIYYPVDTGHKATIYSRWFANAKRRATTLVTHPAMVIELAGVIERQELIAQRILTMTDEPLAAHDFKMARISGAPSMPALRKRVHAYAGRVPRDIRLVKKDPAGKDCDDGLARWADSLADVNDALLAACGIPDVVTDDVDFLTFPNLRVHTFNADALESAREAGVLQS